uniref:Tannase/feruloyl esterase family alpha/beta hydrolase n=1 Tax=Mesocestoides corti TaxID=53468 RepID=A0A5K3FWN3_MESCO
PSSRCDATNTTVSAIHTDIERSHQRVSIGGGSYAGCYAMNALSHGTRGTRNETTPALFEPDNNAS